MRLQAEAPALVLASQSQARLAVLRAAGLVVEAVPARVDEAAVKAAGLAEAAAPEDVAVLLAGMKAERVGRARPEALVIGADQILVCEDVWYDKPADVAAARAQLLALRGRAHRLVTAVVCHRDGQRVWQHVASPRLVMRDFSTAFLDAYLAAEGAAVCASVGAYRLEGLGVHLFAAITGEHAAILGLPVLALLDYLRQCGVVRR